MITLSRTESARIRNAWLSIDRLCDMAHENGASARIPALLAESLKTAKADSPEAAPRLNGAKVAVMGAIVKVVDSGADLAHIATTTQWHLLACALGAALADFHDTRASDEFKTAAAHAGAKARRAVEAYRGARDRWLSRVVA